MGIPTVADRVAQTVVKGRLEEQVEKLFHPDSYGYRPGKSAIQAIGVARERCWRSDWVLDVDIKGFFDNIDHELLMRAVRKHANCQWVVLYSVGGAVRGALAKSAGATGGRHPGQSGEGNPARRGD